MWSAIQASARSLTSLLKKHSRWIPWFVFTRAGSRVHTTPRLCGSTSAVAPSIGRAWVSARPGPGLSTTSTWLSTRRPLAPGTPSTIDWNRNQQPVQRPLGFKVLTQYVTVINRFLTTLTDSLLSRTGSPILTSLLLSGDISCISLQTTPEDADMTQFYWYVWGRVSFFFFWGGGGSPQVGRIRNSCLLN